jgi:hypothetical protein
MDVETFIEEFIKWLDVKTDGMDNDVYNDVLTALAEEISSRIVLEEEMGNR